MAENEDMQTDLFGGEIPLSEIETQSSICTRDEYCKAEADEHHPDCPVEQRLKDTFGF